ncbi:NUDIX hydrolase [Stackebrandtia soli]|uniref:NUDIX hydrolase n=1 Tax=Stackebrandtia soli TaxID=1892856 RepID=UPI0039EC3413
MTDRPAATRRPTSILRSLAYRGFYLLPKSVKRRLVRLATPTYTLGAVILVFSPDESSILLLKQPPGFGWGLPAGLLDRGERPEETAVRELAEETGIVLDRSAVRAATPNAVVHTRGRWVDTVFVAHVAPEEVELFVDGAEVWEAQWWPVSALPPITVAAARLLAHYELGPYADYPLAARQD